MRVLRYYLYERAMARMGFDETAMREIEEGVAFAPERHPVVKGLGGVRKARFARPGMGKSGGGRAIFYLALTRNVMLMLFAYPKSAKEDLTSADRKAILRALEDLVDGDEP